jgi:hypothetical protein
MYIFYSVHNKPLSSQNVLFIYSTKVKYPRIKRVLEIIDSYYTQNKPGLYKFQALCTYNLHDWAYNLLPILLLLVYYYLSKIMGKSNSCSFLCPFLSLTSFPFHLHCFPILFICVFYPPSFLFFLHIIPLSLHLHPVISLSHLFYLSIPSPLLSISDNGTLGFP